MEIIKYSDLDKWIASLKAGTEKKPAVYDVEVKDIPVEAFKGDVERSLPSEFGMKFTKAKKWTLYNLTFSIPANVECAESCFNAEKFDIPLKSVKLNREYKPFSFDKEVKEKFTPEEIVRFSLKDSKNFSQETLDKAFITENNGWMFYNCKDLETVDISSLSQMRMGCAMFANCVSLQEVNMGKLEHLTNARSMFSNCRKLKNVSFENMPNVKITKSMFGNDVNLRDLNTIGIHSVSNIFSLS